MSRHIDICQATRLHEAARTLLIPPLIGIVAEYARFDPGETLWLLFLEKDGPYWLYVGDAVITHSDALRHTPDYFARPIGERDAILREYGLHMQYRWTLLATADMDRLLYYLPCGPLDKQLRDFRPASCSCPRNDACGV